MGKEKLGFGSTCRALGGGKLGSKCHLDEQKFTTLHTYAGVSSA